MSFFRDLRAASTFIRSYWPRLAALRGRARALNRLLDDRNQSLARRSSAMLDLEAVELEAKLLLSQLESQMPEVPDPTARLPKLRAAILEVIEACAERRRL